MLSFYADSVRIQNAHLAEYKNAYWGETNAIYNESVRRYKARGRAVPTPTEAMPFLVGSSSEIPIKLALQGQMLVGAKPIGLLADYLQLLVSGLSN